MNLVLLKPHHVNYHSTARYAHLGDAHDLDAAEQIGAAIGSMGPKSVLARLPQFGVLDRIELCMFDDSF